MAPSWWPDTSRQECQLTVQLVLGFRCLCCAQKRRLHSSSASLRWPPPASAIGCTRAWLSRALLQCPSPHGAARSGPTLSPVCQVCAAGSPVSKHQGKAFLLSAPAGHKRPFCLPAGRGLLRQAGTASRQAGRAGDAEQGSACEAHGHQGWTGLAPELSVCSLQRGLPPAPGAAQVGLRLPKRFTQQHQRYQNVP